MDSLFDLVQYEKPAVIQEDGEDDYEDPAYITPKKKITVKDEVWLISENMKMCMSSLNRLKTETDPDQFKREIVAFWMEACQLSSRIQSLDRAENWNEKICEQVRSAILPLITAIAPNSEPETTAIAPQPEKHSYIEEKVVRKNGKIVGVYQYERWRENGKLKSKYLGSKPKQNAP